MLIRDKEDKSRIEQIKIVLHEKNQSVMQEVLKLKSFEYYE